VKAVRFPFLLEPPADDLVHGLKYEGWRPLARFMAGAMAESATLKGRLARPAAIIPVPTTRERLRSRGYNQAELLAARVAELRGVPLVRALRRTGAGGSQTSLGRDARSHNVEGAFVAEPCVRTLRGAYVWVVDDVLTTGATISEVSSVLESEGVEGVVAVTFARAPRSGGRLVA